MTQLALRLIVPPPVMTGVCYACEKPVHGGIYPLWDAGGQLCPRCAGVDVAAHKASVRASLKHRRRRSPVAGCRCLHCREAT